MRPGGDYHRPESLGAALELASQGVAWRMLAGGTDLFPATDARALEGDILDLTGISGLRGITTDRAGVRIGAMARWSDLVAAPLPAALDALRQAAREVGGRQIQSAGTIGGNLCNASPAADGVPPLLAVNAQVELASVDGTRRLALGEFLAGPRRTLLGPGEILTAVIVPRESLMGHSRFIKLGARRYLVISIAAVAVRLVEREGRLADVAIAVGACSAVARRLPAVEAALRDAPVAVAASLVTRADVAAALAPIDDIRATAAYRQTAAAELVRRAVAELAGSADG